MGLRSVKRQIARARLTVMGVGNVNKKMRRKNVDGVRNWVLAITGKTGESAHKAQLMDGLKRKQREDVRKSLNKRKIRKVTA